MTKTRASLPFFSLMCALLLAAFADSSVLAQRGGPPRRIANPETIKLPGGARVEFKSFQSPSLGKALSYSVFLPPSYDHQPERRYPVVYFLHGLNNDHTSWASERYGNLPRHIEEQMTQGAIPEFLMIHPSGERGFYTDSLDGQRKYESAIIRDMIEETEKVFRVKTERSARAIAGTSMGGYGAMKIALKHPRHFAAVAAGSPIVFLGDDPLSALPNGQSRFAQFLKRMVGSVFGDPVDRDHWKANSVESLARNNDLDGLNIYFFYGTADRYGQWIPLEEGVRTLDRIFQERKAGHTFKVIEGGPHGWELVQQNLDEVISFLTQTF